MYKIYCLSHGGISSEQLFTPLFKVMFFFGPHPAILQPDSIQVCGKKLCISSSSPACLYLVCVTLAGHHTTFTQVSIH